jgi:hypothetical protein
MAWDVDTRGLFTDRDFGATVPARAHFALPLVGVGVLGSGHTEGNGNKDILVPPFHPQLP